MNKTATLFSMFFVSTCFCFAQQDTSLRLLKTIPIAAAEIAVDNLENLYLLTPADGLKKYNADGDSVAAYNNVRRFGKLYSFDVSNPLRPLLFYKDFSTIVLLDAQLSVRGLLDLRRHNIIEASAAALSYDNNIWIFDALENKLKKLSEKGDLLLETADFRTLFEGFFVPEKIWDQNNSLYLFSAGAPVLQFDYFGTFQKKHVVPNWQSIAVFNKNIIGFTNGGIALFNTANLIMQQQYQFPSQFGSFNQYLVGNTKLFARGKDSVQIYSFKFQ